MADFALPETISSPSGEAETDDRIFYRHKLPTRLWHWTNALAVFVMLMSGMMIFNAHPHLYWGHYGANHDYSWFEIAGGHIRIGSLMLPGLGIFGEAHAFPTAITIPSHYDLAGARQWHFAFAWLLVVPGLMFLVWALLRGHAGNDLTPTKRELAPTNIWDSIKRHAQLRFESGESARQYNILQKLSYFAVIFIFIPLMILTGLSMSPGMDSGWPWLLELFGGRQSARSIHFICAMALALFIVVHLVMVVLAGPIREVRSIVTGWYRTKAEDSR